MSRFVSLAAVAVLLGLASPARAEEVKLTGVVTKLDVAADKKSAVATLKDNDSAALVPISVVDDVTLLKFERFIIQVGDEVKVKYEKKGKKNVARSFRKSAGCS